MNLAVAEVEYKKTVNSTKLLYIAHTYPPFVEFLQQDAIRIFPLLCKASHELICQSPKLKDRNAVFWIKHPNLYKLLLRQWLNGHKTKLKFATQFLEAIKTMTKDYVAFNHVSGLRGCFKSLREAFWASLVLNENRGKFLENLLRRTTQIPWKAVVKEEMCSEMVSRRCIEELLLMFKDFKEFYPEVASFQEYSSLLIYYQSVLLRLQRRCTGA